MGPASPSGPLPGTSEAPFSTHPLVDEVEVLGQEISEDLVWVAAPDLVGGRAKVDAFHQVPDPSHMVEIKPPANAQRTGASQSHLGLHSPAQE